MKKFLMTFLSAIMFCCFGLGLVSCFGSNPDNEEQKPTVLGVPTLTATGVTLNWTTVENAVGYVVKINGQETSVNETTYSLENIMEGEYLCSVKAKGDGVSYQDGEYSNQVSVVYETDAPTIVAETNSVIVDKNFF